MAPASSLKTTTVRYLTLRTDASNANKASIYSGTQENALTPPSSMSWKNTLSCQWPSCSLQDASMTPKYQILNTFQVNAILVEIEFRSALNATLMTSGSV